MQNGWHSFSKLAYAKLQMFLFSHQINYFLSSLPVLPKGPKMVAVRNYHGTPAPPGKSSLCFQTGDYIELLKGDPDTAWWEVQHAIASVRKYKLLWGWKPLFHAFFSCFNLYRNLEQAVKWCGQHITLGQRSSTGGVFFACFFYLVYNLWWNDL